MDDIDLVIFDMAGTTIVDAGQVPEAFSRALGAYGIEVTDEALRAVRGASKREAIRHFVERQLPGDANEVVTRTEKIFASFREYLARRYHEEGVSPIPGAVETFAWLSAQGIKIALNTGFDRTITTLLLQAIRWDRNTVHAVICGDDVSKGRPAPYLIFRAMESAGATNVHRVTNVGDTVLDLEAGWNAGVRLNLGVLSGAHTKEQLEKAPHTHLLPSVAALPDLWR